MKKIFVIFSMLCLFFMVSCSGGDNGGDGNESVDNGSDQTEPDGDAQNPGDETADADGISSGDDADADADETGDDAEQVEPDGDAQNPGDETADADGSGSGDDADADETGDDDTEQVEPDGDAQNPDDETADADGSGFGDDADADETGDDDTEQVEPDGDSEDSDTEETSDEDADTDSGESNELPECSSTSATPCKAGGLVWSSRSAAEKDWDGAKSGCSNWSEGRFTGGWRLPTISELRTLIINCPTTETGGNCRVTDQCVTFGENYDGTYCFSNGACSKVFGDICPTSQEHSLFGEKVKLWSSSYQTDNPGNVWYVNFNNGAVAFASDWIDDDINYRCVHSAD